MRRRHNMAKRFGHYVDFIQSRNQKTRALYLLSALGILLFLTIAITLPFRNQLLNNLYPKAQQQAATMSFEPSVDGFEDVNLTGWQKVTETGTSVSITSAAAYAGNSGLYVAVPGGDDGRILKTIPQTPQLYTRIRMKILRDITPRFGQQFFMIGQGGYTGGMSLHLRSDNGYVNRLQGYDPGGQLFDTGISLAPNQWYTFEVYVEPGLQGKLMVWMNGESTPIVNQTGNWTSTPLSLVAVGSDGGSSGNEYYFDDFAMSDATKIGINTPQFGVGPKRSEGSPAGGLPESTTSTQLSIKTSVNATCKYGTENNIDYDQYQNTFSQTGGTAHTQTISNLVKGNSYKYYVRCKDTSGAKNMDDYLIYFTIPFGSLLIDQQTSVTLVPNYETMSVYAKFVGDANKNASAQVFYRESGQSTWKKGMRLTPERRENIPVEFSNQFKGSIFGLSTRKNYDVQVRFDDPDGVNGQPQQYVVTKTATTRDDNPPLGTVQATQSSTGFTISTSGTPSNWISYMPPTNSTSEITGVININANYIRLKGFTFKGAGAIKISPTASNVIIEDNTFITTQNVIREGGAYSGTSATSENITIQNNTFTIPAGTALASKFIDFVNNTKGGHVIRKNTFKDLSGVARVSGQYWDCIGGAPNFSIYGFMHRDSDINDNYFEGCNDDQLEADGGNMNVRIWNNTFNGGLNGMQTMSVDPTFLGPLYVVRNVSYGEHKANFSKLGSDSFGHIYFFHNSHYTTPTGQGFSYANTGIRSVTTRNNIMQVGRYVIELTDGGSTHSFDYDNLYTTDTTRFAKWDGNSTYNTLAKFQTIIQQVDGYEVNISSQNIGQEKNGYNFDMVNDRVNGFMSPTTNDLRLLSTSALIDKGAIIDGINNEDSPWPFAGNGPDIGKYESTTTGQPLPTATPTPIVSQPTPTPTQGVPTPTPTGGVGGVSATSKLSLNPATASRSVGQTLDTTVRVETQNTITNADIALTFNPQILEIVSVTPGTFLPGATEAQEQIDNSTGKLFYSLYTDSSNAKSGTGTLASIQWRAKGAGSSTVSFNSQTTIVYAPGLGNSLIANGLTGATYTVTAVVNPTATPTNAPTATPTQTPPTPTNTPAPVPCTLQNATWSTATAGNGEQVTLRVTTNGSSSCTGKQISFDIHENDSIAEGGLDDTVSTNPANTTISSTTVTRTWQAEWQNDCGGFCNPNEFYFNAQIVGQSGSSIRSAEPYLTISETATPVYQTQVKLPTTVTAQSITNAQFSVSSTEGTITKTISLSPTTTAGVYTGGLPLLIDNGTYTITVKIPGYLSRSFTTTVSTGAPLNLSTLTLTAGDVDNNDVINTLDLGRTIDDYSPEGPSTSPADITKDSKVNALDLGLIIENYFKSKDSQ